MAEISLVKLFFTFFYIGLFTIGGGRVAITLMQQTIVDAGLLTPEQFYNMLAISESTPGPIGVNMATFLGYKFYGIPGALITSFGEVLPSLICILIIARFVIAFRENVFVKNLFSFLSPAATGLIFVVTVQMILLILCNIPGSWKDFTVIETWQNLFNWKCLAFYVPLLWARRQKKLHPILMVVMGAVFGIVFM